MTTSHLETTTAEVLHQNFAEIGFEVELQEIPDVEHNPRRAAGDFSLAVQGLGGVFDPDALHGTHHSDGGRNFGEFSDPEIDALLEQGRTTIGAENRVPIYDEIQTKLVQEHNPQIYHSWGRPVAETPSLAQGLRPNQHANRLHLSVVPVVVRGQARHLRRLAGRTSPPAWEPHPLTPSPAKALERGDWRGKGGSRTAPTGSRSLSIALRWERGERGRGVAVLACGPRGPGRTPSGPPSPRSGEGVRG